MPAVRTPAALAALPLAALLLSACGADEGAGTSACTPPPATACAIDTGSLQAAFLSAHACARAGTLAGVRLCPPPSPPLPALTWSAAAAAVAQAWADGCTWAHNPDRGADGTPRGENLYARAPSGAALDLPADAVGSWGGEWVHYGYAADACAAGEVCGHYTQLVWRATTKVGCAVRTCTTGSPFGPSFPNWDLVVCDYEPPGNVVGQRPY